MTLLKHPIVTEKAMNDMDFENKLQFVVDVDATKPEIAEEIEVRYDVSVASVNTQITMNGRKKAVITLAETDDADELLSRIGVF